MRPKRILYTFCLFCFGLSLQPVHAQEVVFPLGSNTKLESAKKAPASQATFRITSISDTVPLPFVDDFSKPGVYPDPTLWLDSGAFINSTFCDQPVTIGVATLDGLQSNGRPYDTVSGITRICDYLNSNPIDLNFPNDNTIWFSFFFQPQGLGDQPEPADSLALEFRNVNGDWDYMWSSVGKPDTAFLEVFIQISNTDYQYKGFQFRFLNYATPNGNRDHWNLDYIRLDRNRSQGDGISDVAFQYPQRSWLRGLESMPYTHYRNMGIAAQNALMVDSIRDTISNIAFSNTAMDHTFRCIDESGNVVFNQTKNVQIFTGTRIVVDGPLRSVFTFPDNGTDSAVFHIECFKSPTGTFNVKNDTVHYDQKFYNYYAYDDGTAELAYGVNEAGAKIACRFLNMDSLNHPADDTLQGVQMYFNPVGDQVHNKLLQLCLWSAIDVANNSENLVYKRIDMKPANRDSINGFVFYAFDTAQYVPPGVFYVGWTQNDATLLGLGVDMNTPDSTNKFYFYQGAWYQSAVRGAWMIRPVFGRLIPTGIQEQRPAAFQTKLYPNPGDGRLQIEITGKPDADYRLFLYDMVGKLIAERPLISRDVDLSGLSAGQYVLRIENLKDHSSVQTRLILSR